MTQPNNVHSDETPSLAHSLFSKVTATGMLDTAPTLPSTPTSTSTNAPGTRRLGDLYIADIENMSIMNFDTLMPHLRIQANVNAIQANIGAIQAMSNAVDEDEWSLSVEQMFFMLEHNNLIEAAFAGVEDENEFTQPLHDLVASNEFTSLFGDMSFDEAYDRYITMLEEGRA